MACGETVYTGIQHIMTDRQFNYETNPKAADMGLGSAVIRYHNMTIEEGGDHMPGGADSDQIFGFNSKDIALRYIGRALTVTHDWREDYSNNMLECLVRSHAQWMWGSREYHFRCFSTRVPEDPTVPPTES